MFKDKSLNLAPINVKDGLLQCICCGRLFETLYFSGLCQNCRDGDFIENLCDEIEIIENHALG